MSQTYEPGVVVPGARPMLDPDAPAPKFLTDKKGRPLWTMPEPTSYERHFKTAATRRAYDVVVAMGLEPSEDMYTVLVPIYRGIPANIANYIRSQHRRDERKKVAKKQKRKDALKNLILPS